MTRRWKVLGRASAWALAATLLAAAPALGQRPVERFDRAGAAAVQDGRSSLRPIRVAKWGSLLAAAATALYGFSTHSDADDVFKNLERACELDRDRCTDRLPSGAYADPELEALYQEVLDLDHKARISLVASQIGVATTVVLFIMDLRDGGGPENVPYEPERFRVGPRPDGALEFRFALP